MCGPWSKVKPEMDFELANPPIFEPDSIILELGSKIAVEIPLAPPPRISFSRTIFPFKKVQNGA